MQPRIDLITIVTGNFPEMLRFYRDILGLEIKLQMEGYVEFESESVRFAITTQKTMQDATGNKEYAEAKKGQSFELAFRVPSSAEVDTAYTSLVERGAKAIKQPADMPWNQRTAFFADPDGNIHEIFADR